MDDVRTALARLRVALPGAAGIGLLGYSFGAWVSSRVAASDPLPLCLIGPPLGMLDWSTLPPVRPDLCVIAGSRDPYCPLPELERFASRLTPARAAVIDGADHFFFGKLFPMGEEVGRWLESWAPTSAALPGEPGR
jgi:alpha/beta superfamily hydrolase